MALPGLSSAFVLALAPCVLTQGGVFVLDDCDPEYEGKGAYSDNLTYIDSSGKVVFRVTGLNGCETIGSNHQIASDPARRCVWVIETVARRIRKYDLSGKQLLVLNDVKAGAAAADPESGNLWVLTSEGGIQGAKTEVFDPNGKQVAVHDVSGFDLAYDKKDKAFWLVSNTLIKVSAATGKTLVSKEIAAWCAASVAVAPTDQTVWVAVREHPQVAGSRNELLAFTKDGVLKSSILLGGRSPFRVSVDSKTGAAWVATLRSSVLRYTAEGRLASEWEVGALACEADPATGGVWVVTPEETLRLNPLGVTVLRVKHKGRTSEAWLAAD